MTTNQETTHLDAPTPAARAEAAANFREGKKTGKQMLGMPIYSLAEGDRIGDVHSVVYSAREGRLLYVTCQQGGGLFGGGRTTKLNVDDFHSLGEDAITVKDATPAIELDRDIKDVENEAGEDILGKRLMTDDGSFLGNIVDVLIDRHSRRLVAYELSGGLWSDLSKGQTDIPIDFVATIGKEVVIVPASVKERALVANGGLSGVLSAAQEKIDDARTKASVAIEEKEADYALGKVAGNDVTLDDGSFIIRQGELITEEHIRHAMLTDRMHALATAAGKAQAGDLVDATKAKAAGLVESAKDKQGDLLVGKTTGRAVYLDEAETNVLIPANTVIDNTHVEAARAAGKLNALTLAVGANAYDTAKDKAADTYDSAKDSLAERQRRADEERALEASRQPAIAPVTPSVVINNPQNVTVASDGQVTTEGGQVVTTSPRSDVTVL